MTIVACSCGAPPALYCHSCGAPVCWRCLWTASLVAHCAACGKVHEQERRATGTKKAEVR